jgi:hypothetical protein
MMAPFEMCAPDKRPPGLERDEWLQPLLGHILPEILARKEFWVEKSPGAKARIFVGPINGPTEVVP